MNLLKFTKAINVYNGVFSIILHTLISFHLLANVVFMAFVIGVASEISLRRDADKFGGLE